MFDAIISLTRLLVQLVRQPVIDTTYQITLGAATALPNIPCIYVTLSNTSGADVTYTCTTTTTTGSNGTLKNGIGVTLSVKNASNITVAGTGTLDYIVSAQNFKGEI